MKEKQKNDMNHRFRGVSFGFSMLLHVLIVYALFVFVQFGINQQKEDEIEVAIIDIPETEPLELPDDLETPEDTEFMNDNPTMDTPVEPTEAPTPPQETTTVIPEFEFSPLKINMPGYADLKNRSRTALGSSSGISGDLRGTLYDLKRNRSGISREPRFEEDIKTLMEGGFSRKAVREADVYQVDKPIYFSHLLLDKSDAAIGPSAFNVEDEMEPSHFIIHYAGEIQAPLTGEYRFAGDFDDILIVLIDGKPVLEASWGDQVTEWQADPNMPIHPSYTGQPLTYGDWVRMRPQDTHRIDIIIGENPGGHIGGLLMLERKGDPYRVADNGRPILPLFTVQPMTDRDKALMENFANWEFDRRPPPVMGKRKQVAQVEDEDDIDILIQ